ncbi:MAG: hypothetical protein OSJ76_01560 [Alphaproteobacteria bacterium]|nr:hypothetical protein [Alphaproteobacteria bacterium]
MQIYTRGNRVLAYAAVNKINHQPVETEKFYHLRKLSARDVSAMVELSSCIYHSLGKGQECFIHQHDRAYYEQMMDNPRMHFVGAFDGGQLIAMSYVRIVRSRKELFEEFPSRNNAFLGKEFQVACFGADSVHPSYRGNRINENMIRYRMKQAELLGATDCVSIIDRKNIWNMRPYFANEFVMMGADVDPSDGGDIALMHRRLDKTPLYQSNEHFEIPVNDYKSLNKLFAARHIATGYNSETEALRLVNSDYYQPANLMLLTRRNYAR